MNSRIVFSFLLLFQIHSTQTIITAARTIVLTVQAIALNVEEPKDRNQENRHLAELIPRETSSTFNLIYSPVRISPKEPVII